MLSGGIIDEENSKLDNKYLCFCPFHILYGTKYRKRFFDNIEVPDFLKYNQSFSKEFIHKDTLCNFNGNIHDFCIHIDEYINTYGCLDHLALRCYLIAIHGSSLVFNTEITKEIRDIFHNSLRTKLFVKKKQNCLQSMMLLI